MLWYNCYGWWTLVSWYLRVVMTLFTFGTWGSNSSYILLSNSSYIHLSNSSYIHLSNSSYTHLCNSSYIHLCNSSYIHLPENGNFVLDAYNTDSLISITTGGTFTLGINLFISVIPLLFKALFNLWSKLSLQLFNDYYAVYRIKIKLI